LPPHDEGTLIFCTHCGAPQVLLSEELLTQVEAQSKVDAGGTNVGPVARDSRSLVWAGAIRCAALAGAVAAALMGLSILLPPAELLALFWAIVSPVVVIGFFQARFPLVPMTTGFGARLGLLTGISIAVVLSVFNTAKLLVARYGIHAMGEVDKQMNANLDQLKAQALAQPGTPVLPWIDALNIPEFRAGFLLMGVALLTAILLVVTTAGGAFAGFARSRPRV
jgi:hypothetical protein